jgi:hypothetical protein
LITNEQGVKVRRGCVNSDHITNVHGGGETDNVVFKYLFRSPLYRKR